MKDDNRLDLGVEKHDFQHAIDRCVLSAARPRLTSVGG